MIVPSVCHDYHPSNFYEDVQGNPSLETHCELASNCPLEDTAIAPVEQSVAYSCLLIAGLRIRIWIRICRDPQHLFGKLNSDPDPHPHQSGKLDPDPYQNEKVEA